MCSGSRCVTQQCHCVPAGQQIPRDHSSEWALILSPVYVFTTSFKRSRMKMWSSLPTISTTTADPSPEILPYAPPIWIHMFQFHTNQTITGLASINSAPLPVKVSCRPTATTVLLTTSGLSLGCLRLSVKAPRFHTLLGLCVPPVGRLVFPCHCWI